MSAACVFYTSWPIYRGVQAGHLLTYLRSPQPGSSILYTVSLPSIECDLFFRAESVRPLRYALHATETLGDGRPGSHGTPPRRPDEGIAVDYFKPTS